MSSGYRLSQDDHDRILCVRAPPNPAGDSFVDRLARIDPGAHPDRPTADGDVPDGRPNAPRAKTMLKKATALADFPILRRRLPGRKAIGLEAMVHRLKGGGAGGPQRGPASKSSPPSSSASRAAKAARSLLDFDDLVERNGAAGSRTRGRRRLGALQASTATISHILVDEGQDTKSAANGAGDPGADRGILLRPKAPCKRPAARLVRGGRPRSNRSSRFQGRRPQRGSSASSGKLIFTRQGRFQFELRKSAAAAPVSATLPKVLEAVEPGVPARGTWRTQFWKPAWAHGTARAEGGGLVTLVARPLRELEEGRRSRKPGRHRRRWRRRRARRAPRGRAHCRRDQSAGSTPSGRSPRAGRPGDGPTTCWLLVQVRSVACSTRSSAP